MTGASPQRLRVALVGCGVIAPVHLAAITANPSADLVAVCDADPGRAAATGERLGCAWYGDLGDVLAEQTPDIVHVCTPHYLHASMTVTCMAAGVHVLLEKPLATTMADAEAVLTAARHSSALVGVCFQNRYNDTARALRTLLDRGELGTVLGARAFVTWSRGEAYFQDAPWRARLEQAGGGVLINQAIHTLDLLQWYLGRVDEVRGRAARLSLPDWVEVEDTACLQLRHDTGVDSIFYASNGFATDAPVSVEVCGERATARLESSLTVTDVDGTTEIATEGAVTGPAKAYWGSSHGRLIDDFYAHVVDRRPFWLDPQQAMETVRIINRVYEQS